MSTLSKRRRVEHLKCELAHLESQPSVEIQQGYRDKAGRKRSRKIVLPQTTRQAKRIAVLRDKLIPKAKRNVA